MITKHCCKLVYPGITLYNYIQLGSARAILLNNWLWNFISLHSYYAQGWCGAIRAGGGGRWGCWGETWKLGCDLLFWGPHSGPRISSLSLFRWRKSLCSLLPQNQNLIFLCCLFPKTAFVFSDPLILYLCSLEINGIGTCCERWTLSTIRPSSSGWGPGGCWFIV